MEALESKSIPVEAHENGNQESCPFQDKVQAEAKALAGPAV